MATSNSFSMFLCRFYKLELKYLDMGQKEHQESQQLKQCMFPVIIRWPKKLGPNCKKKQIFNENIKKMLYILCGWGVSKKEIFCNENVKIKNVFSFLFC